MTDAVQVLHRAFAATAGGEAGLIAAVAEAIAEGTDDLMDAADVRRIEDALVEDVQKLRGRVERDPLGLVLTPPGVADALLQLIALSFPDEFASTRAVLDPACGTGRLLDAAGTRLEETVDRVGWDVDPVVLHIARGLGSLRSRSNRRGDLFLDEHDGLRNRRPSARPGSLLVLCNPPFVAGYARRSQAAALDLDRLASVSKGWATGAINTAVAFVARIVRDLLRPGEVGGLVLPDAFLNSPRYARMREAWLGHVDAFVVGRLPSDAFPGRVLRPVLVACRRAEFNPFEAGDVPKVTTIEFAKWDEGWPARQRWESIPADVVTLTRSRVIPWPGLGLAHGLVRAGVRTLGDTFVLRDGVNPGSAESRRALISTSGNRLREPRPLIEGRHVTPMRLHAPDHWIESDPSVIRTEWRKAGASLRKPGLFDGPRLYSRQTASRLVVAFCDDESMAINSVHVIRSTGPRWRQRESLLRLAAVLNTEVVSEVYRALFAEDREAFPQVKLTNLRSLPLPWPLPDEVAAAADAVVDEPDGPGAAALDAAVRSWFEQIVG